MSDLYEVLIPWCKLPEHAGQTDDERLVDLQAKTETRVVSKFGSLRTLASVLSAVEYAEAKTILTTAAQSSVIVADMLKMLELPGDASGNGGGVDFGNESVRAMCDGLFSATVAAKLKAIAEENVSQLDLWGIEVSNGHMASARQMIEGGA